MILFLMIFFLIADGSVLAQVSNIRLATMSKNGLLESSEVHVQGNFWATWAKIRPAGSLMGAVFGPILIGPLKTTLPVPGRWMWNWNKEASSSSLGLVIGWNSPLTLWTIHHAQSREQGVQLKGQWHPFHASGSWRRTIKSSKSDLIWVDQIKGGFAWKAPFLRLENEVNFFLTQQKDIGGEGSSRISFQWDKQKLLMTFSGALGTCPKDPPLWRMKTEWDLSSFFGEIRIKTSFSPQIWDRMSFRWIFPYDIWKFYFHSQMTKSWGILPDRWMMSLGVKAKWRGWECGGEEAFQVKKNGWKLESQLYAEASQWPTPGLWKFSIGNHLEQKTEQLLTSYTLEISWKSKIEGISMSLQWKRLAQPWKTIPHLVLIDPSYELIFKVEFRW